MARKKMTTSGYENKKMNESVYEQRRVVMAMIYRAKRLLRASQGIEIPRVDVRITTPVNGEIACGKARMNDNIIWINERYINSRYLYQVVLHELCHTLWGIDHDKNNRLMHPNIDSKLTNAEAEILFLEYAKKYAKV